MCEIRTVTLPDCDTAHQ